MEGSSAPAIGSRRFAAWANRGSAAQRGIHGAKRREPLIDRQICLDMMILRVFSGRFALFYYLQFCYYFYQTGGSYHMSTSKNTFKNRCLLKDVATPAIPGNFSLERLYHPGQVKPDGWPMNSVNSPAFFAAINCFLSDVTKRSACHSNAQAT